MAPQTAVYIIHSSAEAALVRHLTGFIDEAFRGRIAAFSSIDVGGISAGANWIQDITGALDRARMVLCLYGSPTKEGREWMNFELGAAWMKGVPIIPLCHSGQTLAGLPMPLALAQGVELGSENGLRRLHEALARMLDERSEPPHLDGYLALFRDFERHYVGAPRVVHFGRSLDIDLDPGSRMPNAGLPADAVVNSNALEMFGLSGSETTWGRFADRARAMNSDMRWLRELEQSIQLAHADQAFRPAMAVCHTGDGAYQPHLSRKEGLPNGGSRFHVQWFETVAVRMSDFASDVGLLSTLLRLGLRLRYEVVEHFQQRLAVDRSRTGYPDLQPLRRAFETIETEARSLGSERMDTSAVLGLLAGPAEREQLQHAQERWDEARTALFRSDPPLPVADVELHLRALGTANAQMMLLVTRRLHDVVRTQWGVPVPGVPAPP